MKSTGVLLTRSVNVLLLVTWLLAGTDANCSVSCPDATWIDAFRLATVAVTVPSAAPVFIRSARYVTFTVLCIVCWLTSW